MLGLDEENAPNSIERDILSNDACLRIFGNQRECSSQLVSDSLRICFAASAVGLTRNATRSIRLVQLCEKFVSIDELAAIGLGNGLEEHALLLGRDAKQLTGLATQDRDLFTLGERISVNHDGSMRDCPRCDLHHCLF